MFGHSATPNWLPRCIFESAARSKMKVQIVTCIWRDKSGDVSMPMASIRRLSSQNSTHRVNMKTQQFIHRILQTVKLDVYRAIPQAQRSVSVVNREHVCLNAVMSVL